MKATDGRKRAISQGSGTPQERTIDELWQGVVEFVGRKPSARDFELDAWLRSEFRLRRIGSTIFDPEIGLGVQLRWNIALSLLAKTSTDPGFSLPRAFPQLGTLDDSSGSAERKMAAIANDREKIDALCTVLSRTNQEAYSRNLRQKMIDHRDFLVPIHGPRAVFAFRRFLSKGISPISSSGELVPEHKLTLWTQREEALDRIYEYLGLNDTQESPSVETPSALGTWQPIINVQMDGSPFDQCAVAHKIMGKLESIRHQERPILLLPCSRLVAEHDFRGVDFIVHNIHAFLHQRQLSWTPPSYSPQAIPEKILEIRSALAKQPAIIVFVGYQPMWGPSASLRRLILDEPLVPLLSHILHPLVGLPDQPTEVSNLLATKFVVLSEGPMDVLNAYIGQEIEFPASIRPHHYADMLKKNAPIYADSEQLRESLDRMAVHPNEAVVMGYLQLIHVERAAEHEFHRSMADLARYDNADVLEALVVTVKQFAQPLDFLVLTIIACARTGMRRDTLVRCLLMWDEAVRSTGDGGNHQLPRRSEICGVTEEWFDDFLDRFEFIVAGGIDEQLPEVFPGTHPYEYPEGVNPLRGASLHFIDSPPCATSIDFRYGQIRDSFIHYIGTHASRWERPLIHEILCSEALRQQLIVTRHTPLPRKLALRSYRRLLEAIFHGFHSLPAVDDLEASKAWPHLPERTVLPVDAIERFRFLYCTLIMDTLEDGAAYRLSRDWAADALKADLLVLAHNAFKVTESMGVATLAEAPEWHRDERMAGLFRGLARQHYEAAAVAANLLDDLQMWPAIENGARACDIQGSWLEFGVLERAQIDLAAAKLGPTGQVQKMCVKVLESLGLDISMFDSSPWNMAVPGSPPLLPAVLENYFTYVARAILRKCGPDLERLRAVSACLVRLAELHYQTIEYEKGHARWQESMTAVGMLSVAWQLQDHRSQASDGGVKYSLSPSGFRVLARALLECVRYLQTPKHNEKKPPGGLDLSRYLARYARKTLDVYALRYSLFAPDAVSMLILESRYARTVGALNADDVVARHRVALEFLQRAEKRMGDFELRPRLQTRLLIERCATLRGLAAAWRMRSSPSDTLARLYLGLALLDVQQLNNLVQSVFGRGTERVEKRIGDFWRRTVERQRALTIEEAQRHQHARPLLRAGAA